MSEVRQTNPGAWKQFETKLRELDGYEAKIGWFSESVYPSGLPVAYVASLQEYGAGKIPPRMGLRATAQTKENDWKTLAAQLSQRVVDGKLDAHSAVDLVAARIGDDFVQQIEKVTSPPLRPLTLALRYMKDQGKVITPEVVFHTAARLNRGEDLPLASGSRAKPLIDTGRMISTLTHVVTKT